MRVSIAMATYNGSKYVEDQLNSFARQKTLPSEIVIVDDDSKDDTVTIIENYMKKSNLNILLYPRSHNLGVKRTFNEAMSYCSGDIIMFSDQDDIWLEQKISRVVDLFAKNENTMVVINDQTIVNSDLSYTGFSKLTNLRHAGHDDIDFITGCCTSFRKKWRDLIGPIPDAALQHDSWINYPAHLLNVREILEEPLQLYRRHDNTVTTWEVSRGRKPSLIYRLKRIGFNFDNPENRYNNEIVFLTELSYRLSKMCDSSVSKDLPKAIKFVINKRQAISERLLNIRKNRIYRIWPIYQMLRNGHYVYFGGVKSALKDAAMPKIKN